MREGGREQRVGREGEGGTDGWMEGRMAEARERERQVERREREGTI